MLKNIFVKFFSWYKKNYRFNLYLATFLFLWQLVHLYWLTVNVVFLKFFGIELWNVGKTGNLLISIVDYTEIPAIVLTSVLYLNELKERFSWKPVWFLILLNSQWLHLFWITDEIVVAELTGTALVAIPVWLSWVAIFIDYLELPVIYDTTKKAILSLKKKN